MVRHSLFFSFVVVIATITASASNGWAQTKQSELLLPPNTRAWLSIPEVNDLTEAIDKTSLGKMLKDEKIGPFVDDLSEQVRGWLNEKNVQFGLEVEDLKDVHSGEICLAGILGADPKDHATVLLVDVTDTQESAKELLEKVEVKLTERKANKEIIDIGGIKVSKWTLDRPRPLVGKSKAYHAIAGNWLITCDNESVVRDIIDRIGRKEAEDVCLAKTESFIKIRERCGYDDDGKHVRWFIEPFGYITLAQAIAEEKNPEAIQGNDIAKIFKDEGFGAIKGVGGTLKFAEGQHDLVHNAFVYAPPVAEAGEDRYLRAAAMLDFENKVDPKLTPPDWVPSDVATYVSFSFNISKALDRVGYIVESLGAKEGSWQTTLNSMKHDTDGPMVDIPLLFEQFENRITMISASEKPITETSERIVFGINISGDENIVLEHAKKLILKGTAGGKDLSMEYNGREIWVLDTAVDESEHEEKDPLEELLNDVEGYAEEEEEEEEIEQAKPLFERRVATVKDGVLLIGNDVDYIKKILDRMPSKPGRELESASDYQRISKSLEKLAEEIDGDSVIRQFGRLDKGLETNYEMIKQGKMGSSKTLLAQILNQTFQTEDEAKADTPREQKIDPKNMPDDYEADVAPYLGPNGLIVKGVDDGWMFYGCIIPKQQPSQVADETSIDESKPIIK